MRIRLATSVALVTLGALILPLASHGAGECCNAATTLAASVNEPTAGDEGFFKLSNGASNVMLLIDNSGSMFTFPQCTSMTGWGGDGCNFGTGTVSAPATPTSKTTAKILVNGTCTPRTDGISALAWMEDVKPRCDYADPGHGVDLDGATVLQNDRPPWGGPGVATGVVPDAPNGEPCAATWLNYTNAATDKPCSGDNCLFDPHAYYLSSDIFTGYQSPNSLITVPRRAHDSGVKTGTGTGDSALAAACTYMVQSSGKYVNGTDATSTIIDLNYDSKGVLQTGTAAKCTQCMLNHGFFLFNVTYAYAGSSGNYSFKSTGTTAYFRGTFLNANPPKAITARKIVKDLLWIDDTKPVTTDTIRFGVTTFKDASSGQLLFPLAPTKANSWSSSAGSADKRQYKLARKPIFDWITSSSNSYANARSFASNLGTPTAHTLLQIGQYFTDPAAWTAWQLPDYSASGFANPGVNSDNCSICWDCQRNSVVIVTDGGPNEDEIGATPWHMKDATPSKANAPDIRAAGNTNTTGGPNWSALCPNSGDCLDESSSTQRSAILPRVAYFLKHGTAGTGSDNAIHANGGTDSNLYTFAIGFGLPAGNQLNVIKATGVLGSGATTSAQEDGGWYNESSPAGLGEKLYKAVTQVADKENSFSAPSVSAFQTAQTSTSQAFVSRFIPNATNAWEGHVFGARIFDEFVNGCDPTKPNSEQPTVRLCGKDISANFNGNTANGLAVCGEVFLIDDDCDAIQEGGDRGEFFKMNYTTDPANPVLSHVPANFAWDGGWRLNYHKLEDGAIDNPYYRGAGEPVPEDTYGEGRIGNSTNDKARNIYTALPNTAGGWDNVSFTTANVATLQPFMSIDPTWCSTLLTDIGFTATSTPVLPTAAADKLTMCAKAIIYWVRGFDLFDQNSDGCGAPHMPTKTAPTPNTTCQSYGQDRDRSSGTMFWKLGDIFHSSPTTVKAPSPADECDLGYEPQCLATIHSPSALGSQQTPLALDGSGVDAWSSYVTTNAQRTKLVLVGANDGMLHAFHAGAATSDKDAFGNYVFDSGTGEELWAFIPPDMLPKLWRLVKKSGAAKDHQYMVDGSTMLRDVWHDDNGDGTKQASEFRTVAIVTEREGGTKFTALDVTDTAHRGKVKWSFPKNCSDDARYMGQSWSDFAPRPAPIGPVRISSSASRGFDERWIVMVNGGYDPAMGVGRVVYMVDVWTGETLWRFTDDDFKQQFGYGATTSMFPVPGAVALLDVGDTDKSTLDRDGFFDTATWGDLGGNVFVARFHEPGVLDSNNHVTNWYAARTFEQQRPDGGSDATKQAQTIAGRNEFFFMTANAYDGTTKTVRTYLGSGNRERMMQKGAACNTDNLMACCRAGCSVTATTKSIFGDCDRASQFSCGGSGQTYSRSVPTATTACTSADATCATSSKNFSQGVDISVTCPGASSATQVSGSLAIDLNGTIVPPSATPSTPFSSVGDKDFKSTGTLATPPKSRFYGIWSYGGDAAKKFDSTKDTKGKLTSVLAFEANRFTDVPLSSTTTCTGPMSGSCTLVNTTSAAVTYDTTTGATTLSCGTAPCSATNLNAGWFYEFSDDERTGSGATIGTGCVAWNSLQPPGTGTSGGTLCDGGVGKPSTLGYLSDYITGIPTTACGNPDSATQKIARSTPRNSTAPPSTAVVRATINAKGQIEYSTLTLDAGAPPGTKTLGVRSEVVEPVYWLEVGPDLHNCRHVDAKSCK